MPRYAINKRKTNKDRALTFLYKTVPGRACLKIATVPFISRVVGKILDSHVSTVIINPFIKRAGIDASIYEKRVYTSYNDYFSRCFAPGVRNIDSNPKHLISPCDASLTVYEIDEHSVFFIKNTLYSLYDILLDGELADEFVGGLFLAFRLGVEDCHRYIFFDEGTLSGGRYIKGELHSIRPIAFERFHVYKHNCRKYSVLNTRNFGKAVQIEVGAMLVGKIVNKKNVVSFSRGDEKGYFEYGGSTIILLLKKDAAIIDKRIRENSARGIETKVKLGEKIGVKGCLGYDKKSWCPDKE